MKSFVLNLIALIVVVGAALLAYDRVVVRPAQVIGVIDLGEVYRIKEREFTETVTKAGASDLERQKALAMAEQFAKVLPQAIDELPGDCRCLVLLRTALAAHTPNTVDLTPHLKRKLGIR
jgi:hypothetical protein